MWKGFWPTDLEVLSKIPIATENEFKVFSAFCDIPWKISSQPFSIITAEKKAWC